MSSTNHFLDIIYINDGILMEYSLNDKNAWSSLDDEYQPLVYY
jgi:hypothetical protein